MVNHSEHGVSYNPDLCKGDQNEIEASKCRWIHLQCVKYTLWNAKYDGSAWAESIHALRLNTVLSEAQDCSGSGSFAVREISLAMHAWVANP